MTSGFSWREERVGLPASFCDRLLCHPENVPAFLGVARLFRHVDRFLSVSLLSLDNSCTTWCSFDEQKLHRKRSWSSRSRSTAALSTTKLSYGSFLLPTICRIVEIFFKTNFGMIPVERTSWLLLVIGNREERPRLFNFNFAVGFSGW